MPRFYPHWLVAVSAGAVIVILIYSRPSWLFSAGQLFADRQKIQQPLSVVTTAKMPATSLLVTPQAAAAMTASLQNTSLAGSHVDRPLLGMADGKPVLNGSILFYFDYFLSLEGELSLAEISSLVRLDLFANYPDQLAEQLFDLFRRYLACLAEVARREAELSEEDIRMKNLSAADMQNEVRRNHFSPEEIETLFADYDAMLARPSQASRQQKQYEEYQRAVSREPEQLESIATELYGPVAAQNLRNVQYRRQQWQGRMAHYRREKQAVSSAYVDDETGRQQALDLLQQRLFSATELRRVKALERMAKDGGL